MHPAVLSSRTFMPAFLVAGDQVVPGFARTLKFGRRPADDLTKLERTTTRTHAPGGHRIGVRWGLVPGRRTLD